MAPRRRRRKTLRRNRFFFLSDFVEDAKEKAAQSALKKFTRDLKPVLEESLVSAMGRGWKVESVSTEVREEYEGDRVSIAAILKPTRSNPEYEYVDEYSDQYKEGLQDWVNDVGGSYPQLYPANDESGPDFRATAYLSDYSWLTGGGSLDLRS